MARVPEGPHARDFVLTARMTQEDRANVVAGQKARGSRNVSQYIRDLVNEDKDRRASTGDGD